ncbi:MAG TPA: FGGY-family carbohydrate kinase [Casimicrobiaceae bacterium]|nr:FGGY-family carbohydrate kinase [Casimicrobiaceae bacterium]
MRYVVGIDGGTESARANVFDGAGRDLGGAAASYATTFPSPGRAEQDPRDWWHAVGEAVRGAISAAAIEARDVAALAVDTTSSTVVVTDARAEPLRPAILWMDVRAETEAATVLRTGDRALQLNGAGIGPVSAEWMIPKALWLKHHERELYERSDVLCEYQDFIVRRLTGRSAASLTTASIRWHYRSREGGWPDDLLAALDLSELREKWPREMVAAGEVVGSLTQSAAEHLGLTTSTLVVQGGADAFIGTLGLGVARAGQVALITGSSHLQLAVTDAPVHMKGLWGSYADVVCPGRHILEGGQSASGSMIAWLRRVIGTDIDFDRLNHEATKIAPGAEGLIVLDHFQGNRTPHTDAQSRGAVVGLSLGHGRAHMFRAMIEGICLGTRQILATMESAGVRVTEMVVGGGATNSPLWLQIHADTANVPVTVTKFPSAPVLGSAILAAVGAGIFASIDEAIARMVTIDRVIEPDRASVAAYHDISARYDRLYPALKAWRNGVSA